METNGSDFVVWSHGSVDGGDVIYFSVGQSFYLFIVSSCLLYVKECTLYRAVKKGHHKALSVTSCSSFLRFLSLLSFPPSIALSLCYIKQIIMVAACEELQRQKNDRGFMHSQNCVGISSIQVR